MNIFDLVGRLEENPPAHLLPQEGDRLETLQQEPMPLFPVYVYDTINKSSRHPRESPSQVLTEPDLNLLTNPAPIGQSLHTTSSSVQIKWVVFLQCDLTTVFFTFDDAVSVCIFMLPS